LKGSEKKRKTTEKSAERTLHLTHTHRKNFAISCFLSPPNGEKRKKRQGKVVSENQLEMTPAPPATNTLPTASAEREKSSASGK
jgi:hypothetical protein